MKALAGDATLLLRGGRRCAQLAGELSRVERAFAVAPGHTSARWSGSGATAFENIAREQRMAVRGAREIVEHLGMVTRSFAQELADAQLQERRLPDTAAAERVRLEERISLLRRRFRRQLEQTESDLKRLLLRPRPDPARWTGPVRPPGGWRKDLPDKPRWTGPVRPPGGWDEPPRIRLLPAPPEKGSGAAQLPWTPPWLDDDDGESRHTIVQPVGVSA